MEKPLTERTRVCRHTLEERQLLGTWCTPELQEAVNQGYVIRTIHEVWHFPPEQQKSGLFKHYVNTWLKIKTEASGYPSWANTPDKKEEYVTNYRQREGIDLDPDNIEKNPGLKATAKLMLNSFWGKFGENMRKTKTAIVTSPAELYNLILDPLVNISSIRICTEERLEVLYSVPSDEYVENGKTNIFIAAFTTGHARLKLYSYLRVLKEQVLYFDTDSVIYTHEPGQAKLLNGDYLGDLTDELGNNDHIIEFSSAGPKNYGYLTQQGKIECKVRGFTLSNVRGANQLNYQVLKQNVLDEIQTPQEQRRVIKVTNPHFFTRNPATKELKVISRTKGYSLVFDKRVIDPINFMSYPYGFSLREPTDEENIVTDDHFDSQDCVCSLFEGTPCSVIHS